MKMLAGGALLCAGMMAWGGERVVEAQGDLAKTRDAVRALRAQGVVEPITVRLPAGRYACGRPLALDARDSNVAWLAAPGAEVRIAGGILVSTAPAPVTDPALLARLPAAARGQVVQYDLAQLGITDTGDYLYNLEDEVQSRVASTWGQGEFVMGSHPPPAGYASAGRMELFVDDRPMTIARTATNVVFHIDRLLGTMTRTGPGGGTICSPEGRFTVQEEIPAAWSAEPDLHVCGCWCRDWAEQHQRVDRLDRATRTMELSQPYHQYRYRAGNPFFAFNLLCELDEPGEWYFDRATRKLLVWLPGKAGEAHRVELSMSGRLVELAGATNVVFRGVTFETCRNAAVRMKNCEDCRLEDCEVRNVGHHALIVEDGHRCGARACRFHDMGGGGAFLVDGNRATLEPSGHFAENCDMHHFGRWNRMYRPGVCLAGIGMRATGNRIHDAPHAAILFFGCDLLMQSNEIFRVNRETKDCGAFYSGRSWMLRGNRILDNFFHDIIGLGGAYTRTVYLDDSMADTLIAGNRFERCTWAIFIGGSRENVITNNVFVDCPNAFYVDARGRGWQKPHIDGRLREIASKGTLHGLSLKSGVYVEKYPAVTNLPGADPYSPVLNVVEHNIFERGDGTWIARYGNPGIRNSSEWWHDCMSIEEQMSLGTFRNNVIDGQPQNTGVWFVGPNGGAFGAAANWQDGRVPTGDDKAVVPAGRTVVVRADDFAALAKLKRLRLAGQNAVLEVRDVSAEFAPGQMELSGIGQFRAVGTGANPNRLAFRQDNSAFAGSFFFTNVAVSVHGPKTLGQSCPVTFCKTTMGPDCTFTFAAPGVYSSDLVFLPPPGMMWYAVSAVGGGVVVNRGRISIPYMHDKHCGRISTRVPFVQEGLLDLGSRIDLCGPVTLKCPVRFMNQGETFFSDAADGKISFGDGFSLCGGLGLAESFARLPTSGELGPWKVLTATSADPAFGARVKGLLPAAWAAGLRIGADGRSVTLPWRDVTAPQ